MSVPVQQRHITWEEAVEQSRRNRREAAILESSLGRGKSRGPQPGRLRGATRWFNKL